MTKQPFRFSIPNLEEHAKAIGYICIQWASLEFTVDWSLLVLMGKQPDGDEGRCITANISFRDKIAMMRTLGHLRAPNEGWFSALEKEINFIDNDLRNKRNRFVHDLVAPSGNNKAVKLRKLAEITKRPQSRQPKGLKTWEAEEVTVDDLYSLIEEIMGANARLMSRVIALNSSP